MSLPVAPEPMPIVVEARALPALTSSAVRLVSIMAGSLIAGRVSREHPTLALALADPSVFGGIGVALVGTVWSMISRYKLCNRLRVLASQVDDSIAVLRK